MIIPVFDIKKNCCVSGKSGKRDTYSKLNSVYGDNALDIAESLRRFGARYIYIADLDKIEGVGDNSDLIKQINDIIPVLLDNGANCIDDVVFNRNICSYSILATETMNDLKGIIKIFEELPSDNLMISVDMKDNEVLVGNDDILLDDIVLMINMVKVAYTILLNISEVGTLRGNIDPMILDIIHRTPYTQHIIGGGVNNQSIREYKQLGVDNFFIGTILHDGSLLEEYKW